MTQITDYNPMLPDTDQIIPAKEGGNGNIHHPGKYQNVIWQTRRRVPDGFENAIITALEEIFEEGAEGLDQIVSSLNKQRLFDKTGTPWTEVSFRQFLAVNGY